MARHNQPSDKQQGFDYNDDKYDWGSGRRNDNGTTHHRKADDLYETGSWLDGDLWTNDRVGSTREEIYWGLGLNTVVPQGEMISALHEKYLM